MSVRKEVIGNVSLYLGDSKDVLDEVGQVDAVITDPPYGVGFKYATHDDRPEAYEGGYGKWLWDILKKCEDKCLPGSPLFVWQATPNMRSFNEWFPREWRLFIAAKNFVQMRATTMQWSYDPIVAWWTPGEKPWTAGTANRDWMIANTAPQVAKPENIQREHPCPRPLDQVEHIFSQWVRPEGIVLDPFCGSSSGAVAALRTGRKFIGIEKDPQYFELSCRRVDAASGSFAKNNQASLFNI